jgi:hypothetical protein
MVIVAGRFTYMETFGLRSQASELTAAGLCILLFVGQAVASTE